MQPYLPTFQSKRYSIGPNWAEQRPEIESAVARCISLWSYVDNELGGLFGILFGTGSPVAYQIFLSMRRFSHQRDTLEKAAMAVLGKDELRVFKALMREYSALEKDRNTLAHSCYGICPDDDQILFVINVEHHVLWQADILPRLERGDPTLVPHQGLRDNLYVYTLTELKRTRSQMENLWWAYFHLNGYLRKRSDPNRQKEFSALLNTDVVQRQLAEP